MCDCEVLTANATPNRWLVDLGSVNYRVDCRSLVPPFYDAASVDPSGLASQLSRREMHNFSSSLSDARRGMLLCFLMLAS
jgi:hypothetical protein